MRGYDGKYVAATPRIADGGWRMVDGGGNKTDRDCLVSDRIPTVLFTDLPHDSYAY